MSSSFKIKHIVSRVLMLEMLAIIIILFASCRNSTDCDSETSDNINIPNYEMITEPESSSGFVTDGDSEISDNINVPNYETITETPESSSEPMTDDEGLGEITESNAPEEPNVDNNIYIIVENNSAKPGDKNVEINVLFKNNPGIFGMDFDLYYDESVMTLIDTVSFVDIDNCVFTQPKKYHTPTTFLWDFQDDVWDRDGLFLKLLFNISETAQSGDYAIEIKYSLGNIFDKDFNPIIIYANNGMLNILD